MADRFTTRDRKQGGCFYKTNRTNTHTQKHTRHDDQRNAGIARICYRGSHTCSSKGRVMSPTQTGSSLVVIVVQQRTVALLFVLHVLIAVKVQIPPLSLMDSQRLPRF